MALQPIPAGKTLLLRGLQGGTLEDHLGEVFRHEQTG